MEQHINALSKLCRICKIQLTRPYSTVRSVLTIEDLRNQVFPFDPNLFPNNVCQKCKRIMQKDVIRYKAFQRSQGGGKKDAETFLKDIGGRENLSAQSGIFLAHTAYSCVICFPNLENASDTEFQTPPDSPTRNSPPPNAMDIDMITSTPVRQPTERAAHNLAPPGSPITIMPPPMDVDIISGTPVRQPRATRNNRLDASVISIDHSEYVHELPFDEDSFMMLDSEVEEINTVNEYIGRVSLCDCVPTTPISKYILFFPYITGVFSSPFPSLSKSLLSSLIISLSNKFYFPMLFPQFTFFH